MAGIYIHIPFCKQPCNYCNFYFTTSKRFKTDFINALCKEIKTKQNYLGTQTVETIYFGGGTPSQLSINDIETILNQVAKYFKTNLQELTFEVNPDDLTLPYLKALKKTGVNRLSIGTQSFLNTDLQFMKRAHNANQALTSIKQAQQVGFTNLSVDLIYGLPKQSNQQWLDNLAHITELNIPHLSSYALTVEENTRLYHDIKKGKTKPLNEQQASAHFNLLMQWAKENGYLHYEISNFAQPNKMALHNTSYWQNKPYLGLGPAAHSYNGNTRQWNIANLAKYIKLVNSNQPAFTTETLPNSAKYNEYVMTGLRTQWGINLNHISNTFGNNFNAQLLTELKNINPTFYNNQNNIITLTNQGKHYADVIAAQLFSV